MKKLIFVFGILCIALALSAPLQDDDEEDELDEFDGAFFDSIEKARLDVMETDIIKPNQEAEGMANAALRKQSSKWPNGVVPFKISPNFYAEEKQKIRAAMKEMEQKTCIRFKRKTPEHKDFIAIARPERGCNSYVGRIGGIQEVNLGPRCLDRSTILHELMHALGFIHEHNRPDRDRFVTIKYGNVIDDQKHNFNKRADHEVTLLNTEYAYESIMHYHRTAFAKDSNKPTIVTDQKGVRLGGEEKLSDIDALRINRHYCEGDTTTIRDPPPPPPREVVTPPPGFHWHVQGDGITWAMDCDHYGNDIGSKRINGEQCGPTCASDPNCDHFTWNHHEGGTCWLKKGYRTKKPAISRFVGAVCGYVTYKI